MNSPLGKAVPPSIARSPASSSRIYTTPTNPSPAATESGNTVDSSRGIGSIAPTNNSRETMLHGRGCTPHSAALCPS